MKKKVLLAILALVSAVAITACTVDGEPVSSLNNQGQSISMPINDGGTTPTVTPGNIDDLDTDELNGMPVIGERTEVNGMMQSYLTGEWKTASVVNRRPMAVMIPNNKAALPQYGISYASVIYEAPMEALSCTRLMGIFEDYDSLDHIGPVRSSRLYFLEEAMSYDAIYCNWGLAVPYVGPVINTDRVDNISAAVAGIDNPSDEAFTRDENRRAMGYAIEYTGIMTIDGYNQAVQRQGYSTTRRSNYESTFVFAQDGFLATYDDGITANTIAPVGLDASSGVDGGFANARPYFVYNSTDHLYYRYQYGEPQMDEQNNTQLAVTNVVFMYVEWAVLDNNGYLVMLTNGTGAGYVFTNGTCIPATWTRDEFDSSACHYYAQNHEEIVFNQGKTWVCLIPNDCAAGAYVSE